MIDHETIQEHADYYLEILMKGNKISLDDISDVGLAVERLLDGEVESKYSKEQVEREWVR